MTLPRIAVIGAGLAGLCLARELSRCGATVRLVDQGPPGRGASWAAAGMLAPTFETTTEGLDHPHMFELLFAARTYWADWIDQGGPPRSDVGYRDDALIALATTPGEAAALQRQIRFQRARALDASEQAGIEPMLGQAIQAAVALPQDGQVDNRALVDWLVAQLGDRGVELAQTSIDDGDITPSALNVDLVVDARGWAVPGMTPVKGTAMALAHHPGLPNRLVRWGRNYLVPKADRVVLGAHAMPGLSDTSVDPAIIAELRDEGALMFPAVADAEILETWSGVRPRLADGGPVLGWRAPGTYMLGGMYRDGVLLAPLLAHWAARDLMGEAVPDLAQAFRPARPGARLA